MNYRFVAVIIVIIVVVALGAMLLMHRGPSGSPQGTSTSTVISVSSTSSTYASSTSPPTATTTTTTTSTNSTSMTVEGGIQLKQINSTWYEFVVPYPKENYFYSYNPINKTYTLSNISWYVVVTEQILYNPITNRPYVIVPWYISLLNSTGASVWEFWFGGEYPMQIPFGPQDYKFEGNYLILYVKTQPGLNLVPGKTYTFMFFGQESGSLGWAGYFNATYVG